MALKVQNKPKQTRPVTKFLHAAKAAAPIQDAAIQVVEKLKPQLKQLKPK